MVNEAEKQNNSNYIWCVRGIENLSYFNGLVNSVLDEKADPINRDLQMATNLYLRDKNDLEQELSKIYNQLGQFDIDIDDFVYKDYTNKLTIDKKNLVCYCKNEIQIVPQTLCDFFTDTTLKEYVKLYVTKEHFCNNTPLCKYLNYYNLLPVSWLIKGHDGKRITFFKDRMKSISSSSDSVGDYYDGMILNNINYSDTIEITKFFDEIFDKININEGRLNKELKRYFETT